MGVRHLAPPARSAGLARQAEHAVSYPHHHIRGFTFTSRTNTHKRAGFAAMSSRPRPFPGRLQLAAAARPELPVRTVEEQFLFAVAIDITVIPPLQPAKSKLPANLSLAVEDDDQVVVVLIPAAHADRPPSVAVQVQDKRW